MNDRLGVRKLDTFKPKFVKYFGRKDFSFGSELPEYISTVCNHHSSR